MQRRLDPPCSCSTIPESSYLQRGPIQPTDTPKEGHAVLGGQFSEGYKIAASNTLSLKTVSILRRCHVAPMAFVEHIRHHLE